jgi:hypothetical protein
MTRRVSSLRLGLRFGAPPRTARPSPLHRIGCSDRRASMNAKDVSRRDSAERRTTPTRGLCPVRSRGANLLRPDDCLDQALLGHAESAFAPCRRAKCCDRTPEPGVPRHEYLPEKPFICLRTPLRFHDDDVWRATKAPTVPLNGATCSRNQTLLGPHCLQMKSKYVGHCGLLCPSPSAD